jgi:hypothetical protein
MSDYLARLGARALGVASAVRPAVAPLFSPADRSEATVTARLAANARAFDASRGDSKDARADDADTRALDAALDATHSGMRESTSSEHAWLTWLTQSAAATPRETSSASSRPSLSSWSSLLSLLRDDASSSSRDRSTVDAATAYARARAEARAALDREERRAAIAVARIETLSDRGDAASADLASRRHAAASASADDAHAARSRSDRDSDAARARALSPTSAINARNSDISSRAASSKASRALNIRTPGEPSSLAIRPAATMRDGADAVGSSPHAHATNAAEFLARLGALGPRGRRDRDGDRATPHGAESAPIVRINIGRVEVRGGSPRAVIAPPPAAVPRQDVTLADYLTRKRGEQP